MIGVIFITFLAISALEDSKVSKAKLEAVVDFKHLREFTFYYHTHDGESAIHKRVYVTTPSEEDVLSQYIIDDQESSGAWPYFDRVDSISIATLDTLSIGHNYPCKMLQLQWKEKIIWIKN
ncbi:hypothetical protein K9M48_02435 [Candidatus Gracilibacteria bacterium]|nr:hypothetical protein [Candidatus Gracilibacteria bacterium]